MIFRSPDANVQVSVVDAAGFLKCMMGDGSQPSADTGRQGLCSLLVEQVEFANVVLLNKMDLVNEQQTSKLKSIVQKLNPSATIMEAVHCNVPMAAVLKTKRCVLHSPRQQTSPTGVDLCCRTHIMQQGCACILQTAMSMMSAACQVRLSE